MATISDLKLQVLVREVGSTFNNLNDLERQFFQESLDSNGALTAPLKLDDGTLSDPGLTFDSETTLGFYRESAGRIGCSGNFILEKGTPRLQLHNTSAGTDEGLYSFVVNNAGSLLIRAANDAESSAEDFIIITRTGTAIDTVNFNTATIVIDERLVVGDSQTPNQAGGDILAGNALILAETTTPTADTNYGKVYTKTDNKLYFQDGAGVEHEIAFV